MTQLLDPGWWFSFFGQAVGWWVFCLLASFAALPLCLRMFRGLADRGAGLSVGVGLILINQCAWLMSLGWFGGADQKAALVRLVGLGIACALLTIASLLKVRGYVSSRAGWTLFAPALLLGVISVLPLPHHAVGIWFALLLVLAASIASWWHDPGRLRRELRISAIPFVAAQLLFLVSFLFFVNVRSYIPYATFELSLWQAEKWGNLTHLQSVMTSDHMPPSDIWMNRAPVNYYYGGHLLTATIAKATGTSARVAFNLGLATTFALTMSMGFCFMLSLVHLTTRKFRLVGRVIWHHGMAWGLFGALAVAMFGNLDPWRQLLTRDLDYGVRQRWERKMKVQQEEWKLRTGIPAAIPVNLVTASASLSVFERPDGVLGELKRSAQIAESTSGSLQGIAAKAEDVIKGARADSTLTPRQIENLLTPLINGPDALRLYDFQTNESSVRVQDELFRMMAGNEFEKIPPYLRGLAGGASGIEKQTEAAAERIRTRMDAAMEGRALRRILSFLQDEARGDQLTRLLGSSRADSEWKLESVYTQASFAGIAGALSDFRASAEALLDKTSKEDLQFSRELDEALGAFYFSPVQEVEAAWGTFPVVPSSDLKIEDLRYTWENASLINFWEPSRAIKGTPSGVKEPGTITEFPYFSAILGDHHAHHMAIPFTLAALCACLSLLRKNGRLRRSEAAFFRRSWPELVAMAFFIGAVFPVNIWDSVVLAPLYGVVILIARRGVEVSPAWRWLGFVGWLVLLSFVVGVPMNSVPGIVPLFQNFKFFLLACVVLVIGFPALQHFRAEQSRVPGSLMIIGAALLIVFVGGLAAPGAGGSAPARLMASGIRDLLIFAAMALLARSWALRARTPVMNWWYAAGGIYAAVGALSLVVTLPFKAYFQSPLEPENKLLYDLMPPFLSWEVTHATEGFWQAFWKASPVNPFPAELRTDFRDIIVHWGIFLLPILVLVIARFTRATRGKPPGFAFMIAMLVLAIVGFTRNYLGYWAGPFSLGMMVLSFFYAMEFRRRAEGACWGFLVIAFFWTWFVEALHFDDGYSGNLERYNTPFKIYYPIWAMYAGGMVVGLREILARFRITEFAPRRLLLTTEFWILSAVLGVGVPLVLQGMFPEGVARAWFLLFWIPTIMVIISCVISHTSERSGRIEEALTAGYSRFIARWPALVVALFIGVLGMYYPLAATVSRTREFFTWPLAGTPEATVPHRNIFMNRTLDSIQHLAEYPAYCQDYKAMTWLGENAPRGSMILERAGEDPYGQVGRMSTGSGLPTIMGWKHHEHQWRGRAAPAPLELKHLYASDVQNLSDFTQSFSSIIKGLQLPISPALQSSLRLSGAKDRLHILRKMFPNARLSDLYRLRRIVEREDLSNQLVMDAMLRHAQEMYTANDEAHVRNLFARYGIKYVVVGELERAVYGTNIASRFSEWEFPLVYDSGEEKSKLPGEGAVSNPTLIYEVPTDFPSLGAEASRD